MTTSSDNDEFAWDKLSPDQVKEADHVRVFDIRTQQDWVEGEVDGGTGGAFIADPYDPNCQEWVMLLRLQPTDRSIRLVSTDREVMIRRPHLAPSERK